MGPTKSLTFSPGDLRVAMIGDEILPSYVRITVNHENKDPYKPISIMKRHKFFFFRDSDRNRKPILKDWMV